MSTLNVDTISEKTSGNGVQISGHIIQIAKSIITTQTSGATTIPSDTSIPQANEGNALTSITFTPKSASSIIRIHFWAHLSLGTSGSLAVLLADANTATDCLALAAEWVGGPNEIAHMAAVYEEASGSTSARTYYTRYGAGSGTCYLNQGSAAAYYGGKLTSGMIIEEYLA